MKIDPHARRAWYQRQLDRLTAQLETTACPTEREKCLQQILQCEAEIDLS